MSVARQPNKEKQTADGGKPICGKKRERMARAILGSTGTRWLFDSGFSVFGTGIRRASR